MRISWRKDCWTIWPIRKAGEAVLFEGEAGLKIGDILEFRDGDLRRLDEELAGEWGGAFQGQLVGRVDRSGMYWRAEK